MSKRGWHRWYAWFPVVDFDGNRKWLEWVERCGTGYNGSKPWAYAPLPAAEAGGQGWFIRLIASRVRGPAPKRPHRKGKSASYHSGISSSQDDRAVFDLANASVTTSLTVISSDPSAS